MYWLCKYTKDFPQNRNTIYSNFMFSYCNWCCSFGLSAIEVGIESIDTNPNEIPKIRRNPNPKAMEFPQLGQILILMERVKSSGCSPYGPRRRRWPRRRRSRRLMFADPSGFVVRCTGGCAPSHARCCWSTPPCQSFRGAGVVVAGTPARARLLRGERRQAPLDGASRGLEPHGTPARGAHRCCRPPPPRLALPGRSHLSLSRGRRRRVEEKGRRGEWIRVRERAARSVLTGAAVGPAGHSAWTPGGAGRLGLG
jgi:hypothetical protein